MALFVEELGIKGPAVPFYAGIAVASSSLTSALMAPIWGSLADRYGRKPMMLRASIAMTMTMGGIAFVPSVFWLLLLRLLNGVFSGFVPNSTALIASQVPKNQSGYALGTLSTVNSWLAGADVVPPGAVAVADMMYLPSGSPLMLRPSMIHLPWPSAVTG